MRAIYDIETDILNIIFKEETVAESDEIREGIIIDYNKEGKIVSIEVLDASEHIIQPLTFAYEIRPSEKVAVQSEK